MLRYVVLAEGLNMFRLGNSVTGWKMNLSGNLSLMKRILAGCLGVEPRGMGSLWLKAYSTWGGGVILAEGLHDCGRWVMPSFTVIP
jgi:hypothetical protein